MSDIDNEIQEEEIHEQDELDVALADDSEESEDSMEASAEEPTEEEFAVSAEDADAPEEDVSDSDDEEALSTDPEFSADGTELEAFESAEIEEKEFVESERIQSIVESVLFATEKPQSLSVIKQAFKGTSVKTKDIREAIQQLMIDYASGTRGFTLEEVNGGYQMRTKVDNMEYLKRMVKARPFKLSGPALEVMSIVAYKQPVIKAQIDEIRGVESGHLLRALMEKSLVAFAGKSEFPGKPMLYQTTRKFLEIFGLRNLKELPSLSEIDELIPEGIGEEEEKESLSDVTQTMSEEIKDDSYSEGEEELMKITEQLSDISTSSEFFEQEKARAKAKRDAERAQDIRDALEVGEEVSTRDKNWLERYDQAMAEAESADVGSESPEEGSETAQESADAEQLEASEESAEATNLESAEESDRAVDAASVDSATEVAAEPLDAVSDDIEGSEELVATDVAGEPEADLQTAVERFDQEEEESKEGFVGDVDVARLKSDLDVFEE